MTCKRIDDYNYWSDQHHALLVYCAEKALRIFSKGNGVEIDELVNVGWIRTLRRRRPEELKGCGSFTILHMLDYLSYSARGVSHYKAQKYGVPDVVPIGEGFDVPCDEFDPVAILIRREEAMKYICVDCGYITDAANWLTADNPFEPGEKILGCPNCSQIDTARGIGVPAPNTVHATNEEKT